MIAIGKQLCQVATVHNQPEVVNRSEGFLLPAYGIVNTGQKVTLEVEYSTKAWRHEQKLSK